MKYLHSLEVDLNVKFPDDFLSFIKINFGDKPEDSIFKVGKGMASLAHFLHFQDVVDESLEIYSIEEQKEDIDEYLSDKIVPIAITYDSNLIALDFRETTQQPTVIFIISGEIEDGVDSIRPICSTFSEFLMLLESD